MPKLKPKFSPRQMDDWRGKIKTGMLLDRLHKAVAGKVDMTTAQMRAAEILLKKALPDLSSVEISGGSEPVQFTWKPAIIDKPPEVQQIDTAKATIDITPTVLSDENTPENSQTVQDQDIQGDGNSIKHDTSGKRTA